MNINQDRNSHWPIYDKVPIELIEIVSKVVSDTVKKAKKAPEGVIKSNESKESKDGLVIYFPSREKERG